jgi:hypothetical protein
MGLPCGEHDAPLPEGDANMRKGVYSVLQRLRAFVTQELSLVKGNGVYKACFRVPSTPPV